MPKAIIENFSRGLDVRRSNLSSILGVIEEIQNAFINEGGEIEKRKAFVGTDLTPTAESGVSTIFGIEALRDYIMVFGGETNLDALWPPAGYAYTRLYRPATAGNAEVKATGIIYSTAFNNKTFVIARMADGVANVFYDGAIIYQLNFFGRILPDMDSKAKLFAHMALAVSQIPGFTGAVNGGGTGITITGQPGAVFDVLAEGVGTAFESTPFVVTKLSNPVAGQPGTSAIGSFTITDLVTGAPTVQKVTSLKVGGVELLLSAVGLDTSPEAAAAAIVAAVNSNPIGFSASNSGGTVTLTATTPNNSDNGKQIVVTTIGKVLIGSVDILFSGEQFTVNDIKAGATNLLTTTWSVDTSAGGKVTDLVVSLAGDINSGVGTHGYVAITRGTTLKIGKQVITSHPPDPSSLRPNQTVQITVDISSTTGGDVTNNGGVISALWDTLDCEIFVSFAGAKKIGTDNRYGLMTGITAKPIKFRIVGGAPPYTINYTFDNGGGPFSFVALTPNSQITHIEETSGSAVSPIPQPNANSVGLVLQFPNAKPTVKVTVRDSANNIVDSATIPIKFTVCSPDYLRTLLPN